MLSSRNLGDKNGEETHTLTVNEMPQHSHSLTRRSNFQDTAFDPLDAHKDESSAVTTDRTILGQFNTNTAGGSAAHNNMQPFIVLRTLIKY